MVSWFISPWEAARFSMEAQRLIALQFFDFALPQAQPKEEPREEGSPPDQKASVARPAPIIGSSEDPLRSSERMRPVRKRTVAARSKTHMTRTAPGPRKGQSKAGKGKK